MGDPGRKELNPLKDLYDRKASALHRRPHLGRGAAQTRLWSSGGVVCDAEDGDRTQRVDLPPEDGGTSSGPSPGQLMRAAIGGCVLTGYRIWAARLDVPVDQLYLELTADFDARGALGLAADVPVCWRRLVFDVNVGSGAPEADLRRVIETANRLSPMLANLSPAITQVHRLTIVRFPPGNESFRQTSRLPRERSASTGSATKKTNQRMPP